MKTTTEQFDEFVKQCWYYIDMFELNDWQYTFIHAPLPNSDASNIAGALCNLVQRTVSMYLNDDPATPTDDLSLQESAKHEVIHVLLAALGGLAHERFVRCDEVIAAEEALVQKLIRLLPV